MLRPYAECAGGASSSLPAYCVAGEGSPTPVAEAATKWLDIAVRGRLETPGRGVLKSGTSMEFCGIR